MTTTILQRISWISAVLVFIQGPMLAKAADAPPGRVELGILLGWVSPRGEFRQNTGGRGFSEREAVGLDMIVGMHKSGIVRLRFDCLLGDYQKDSVYEQRYGFRSFSLGPEIGVSRGPIRPYASLEFGRLSFGARFWQTKEESQQIRNVLHGTNQWIYSGGIRVPVGSAGRWAIDVGLRYHRGGVASYGTDGSIQHNPDGTLAITPTRSRTQFLIFMLGVQVLGKGRR